MGEMVIANKKREFFSFRYTCFLLFLHIRAVEWDLRSAELHLRAQTNPLRAHHGDFHASPNNIGIFRYRMEFCAWL